MVVQIGINGFGRIGRVTFRALLEKDEARVVAINDLADSDTLAHLLRYDSLYGPMPGEITVDRHGLQVDGDPVHAFQEKNPEKIPWGQLGVDLVIESTGVFRTREEAGRHLQGGAGSVIVTAPMKDPDLTVVMGVNQDQFHPKKHRVISNASCTTNALAPVAMVLHREFGLLKGLMNTTHAYTNDQRLLDFPHDDLRRARAAFLSLIPTTTGAARAVGEVLPELEGRIDGFAVRVPTPTVSLLDLVALLEEDTTTAGLNEAFIQAARQMPGILHVSREPLVSVDYKRSPYSSVIDALSTMVVDGNLARVVAWYDNEWSYSCRVADLAIFMKNREREEKEAVGAGKDRDHVE